MWAGSPTDPDAFLLSERDPMLTTGETIRRAVGEAFSKGSSR